eukprot:COSAG01_NODE_2176_length_8220_cov_15.093215_5_plen_46_part_00
MKNCNGTCPDGTGPITKVRGSAVRYTDRNSDVQYSRPHKYVAFKQ